MLLAKPASDCLVPEVLLCTQVTVTHLLAEHCRKQSVAHGARADNVHGREANASEVAHEAEALPVRPMMLHTTMSS